MYEILITASLLILSLILYTIWYKPLKQMNLYTKLLTDRGYKVLQLPFNPLYLQLAGTVSKGKQKGDANILYKQDYQGYDVIVCNYFIWPHLQFLHPDFIKEFYAVDKHYQYPKQQKVNEFFTRIGVGLGFTQGKVWKRRRNVLNKIFNFDFVKSLSIKISQICDNAIKQMEKISEKNQSEKSIKYNLLNLTVQMFSQVTLSSFLGSTKNQKIMNQPVGKFITKLMGDITSQILNPLNLLLGPKYLNLGLTKSHRDINERLNNFNKWGHQYVRKRIKQIQQRLNGVQDLTKVSPNDIIEALLIAKMNAKLNKQVQQFVYNQQEIFGDLSGFVVAGTDTTSHYVEMMIYHIARNPEIEAKVREQINTYMSEDDYSYQNLKHLKYIENIQKEATRFSGPASHLFQRNANVDNYLNGLPIKKGTSVTVMQFANHYSQKYFKNPKQFRPERWENECNNLPPFILGGFSAGARSCIGKSLALLQSKIALVKFLKRYKKIVLPNPNFKMDFKFVYCPEVFDTTMYYE